MLTTDERQKYRPRRALPHTFIENHEIF